MTLRRVLCCLAAALVGCGGSGGATDPDAGPLTTPDGALPGDGATPTTPPFDPEMTYPGEGEACRVSLDCADRQICVDEVCRRHERYAPGELTRGEWRILTPTETRETRLYRDTEWGAAMGGASGVEAIYAPTPESGELLYLTRELDGCEVLRVGAEIEQWRFDGMICSTATRRASGELAIGGLDSETLEPRLVVLDADGEVLQDVTPLEQWDEIVAEEVSARGVEVDSARLAAPTSLAWRDRWLYVAVEVGPLPDMEVPGEVSFRAAEFTVFARLAPNGAFELLAFDGQHVQEGGGAWLLQSSSHGLEALLRPIEVIEESPGRVVSRVEALAMDTGERRVLHEGPVLGNMKSAQGTADAWRLFLGEEARGTRPQLELCSMVAIASDGTSEVLPWVSGRLDGETHRWCYGVPGVVPLGARAGATGLGWFPVDGSIHVANASHAGADDDLLTFTVRDWRAASLEALRAEAAEAPDLFRGITDQSEALTRFGQTAEFIAVVDQFDSLGGRIEAEEQPIPAFWVAEAVLSEGDAR